MDLSLVIPLKNEAESLPELCRWIAGAIGRSGLRYEIILVDDGSTDGSWEVICGLRKENSSIKGLRFQRNYGKSAALNEGFRAATGQVVITMDADLQDSPDEILPLYKMVAGGGYDLVSGWKKVRHDNRITKNIPSRVYNRITGWISGIRIHDFNCGLKAYRLSLVQSLEVYGEMHRYIPVIAKMNGFSRIGEKEVQHRPRKYGVTKFGWERFVNGFLDLMSVLFIGRFGKKPMHLFGLLGTLAFLAGFIISIYLGIAKFVFRVYQMTERPIFYIALVAMIIGVQLFLAGFLAELTVRNSQERNHYLVEDRLGF